jgi:tetratricopeptide (TPR) repeat protein
VNTTKLALLVALALVLAPACKKEEETVEPEEEWMPDESLEPEPAPVGSEMSEEEKLDKAKGLYVEAEGKAAEGDWAAALPLYEQAYTLVPGKHGFALKVGTAAEQVGDCAKAITYYEHFLTYADADKYADDIKSAKKAVANLKKQGCEGAE